MTVRTRGFAAIVFAATLGLAVSASAEPGGEIKTKQQNGTAVTDGALTPGGREVLRLKGMPARLPYEVIVEPDARSPSCVGYTCTPSFAKRWPGTRPFRTSGTGRSKAVLRIPLGYTRFRPTRAAVPKGEFVPFADGERVRVQANGFVFKEDFTLVGIADTHARISLP